MKHASSVAVIGGGLAGCEAAWQLLQQGRRVTLYEMKPQCFSPAHKSPHLAELVCSNSLRSNHIGNAVGLLKEEMRRLDSLIIAAADANSVPAGTALAVDRWKFSQSIEQRLFNHASFEIVRTEMEALPPERPVIIATGPLTSPALAQYISSQLLNGPYLYFYDAISPIIAGESIDRDKVFRASRYEEGAGDYLNCPLDRQEYEHFWQMLTAGEEVPLQKGEEWKCFEGCMPIESMAKRGMATLAFGPMKPVGLIDPRTGQIPYAVVQLRQENLAGSLYNMVGFQTKLTWPEQRRIFRTIPGLEKADFLRYGSIHRNTFLNAPSLLNEALQLRSAADIFFAGQMTGVEGYVESAAMGLMAGLSAASHLAGRPFTPPPATTAHGALLRFLTVAQHRDFQPMNVNFGLFPPLPMKAHRQERGPLYAARALQDLERWLAGGE